MARILETLRHGEARRARGEPGLAARAFEPAPVEEAELAGDGEIPFIEVGGPHQGIEASPSVLAVPVPGRPTAAVVGKTAAEAPVVRAQPALDGFARVTFHPLPAEPPATRPAYERFAPELVAFHQPEHPVSEQYRGLLAGIEAQLPAAGPRVLLGTGACPGVGTTTVLLNLAITHARRGGGCVVLVEANQRRPAVAARLGLRAKPGLGEVLAGRVAPERAVQETGEVRFQVVTAGNDGPLTAEGWPVLLDSLRSRFELVLVDAPAWDEGADMGTLARGADAVYLVATPAQAEGPEALSLAGRIPRLRGTIVTRR